MKNLTPGHFKPFLNRTAASTDRIYSHFDTLKQPNSLFNNNNEHQQQLLNASYRKKFYQSFKRPLETEPSNHVSPHKLPKYYHNNQDIYNRLDINGQPKFKLQVSTLHLPSEYHINYFI